MKIPSLIRKLFFLNDGELKYESKVLVFWIVGILASIICGFLFSLPFLFVNGGFWQNIAINQGVTIGFLFASFFSWFYLSKDRVFDLSLGLTNKKWMKSVTGFFFGFLLITVFTLAGFGLGFFHFTLNQQIGDEFGFFLFNSAAIFIFYLFTAMNEELMFRGFPMQINMNKINMWYRVIFLSTIFCLLHFQNSNLSWLGFVNIFLAGLWLSFGAISENTIWYSFGLHLGWNFTQAYLFNLPVSGESFFPDIHIINVETVLGSSDLLTGGKFGAEGSIISTVLILIAVFYEKSKIK